jgi:hypothetical protein
VKDGVQFLLHPRLKKSIAGIDDKHMGDKLEKS